MARSTKASRTAKLPLRDMVNSQLQELFPQLTPAQVEDLKAGRPIGDAAPQRPEDLSGLPRVSCVMTVSDPRRVKMARASVNRFARQTYPNKQLVIVNATGRRITDVPTPEIVELFSSEKDRWLRRDVGLDAADGAWVVPFWDDDDVHHPEYLYYLMAAAGDRPVTLERHARFSVNDSEAMVYASEGGVRACTLFPSGNARFGSGVNMTGAYMIDRFEARFAKPVVRRNRGLPYSFLHVAAYHGTNQLTRDEFFPGHSSGIVMSPAEFQHLNSVLAGLGFTVQQVDPS